ncbi:MAG: hypothetical protein M1830_000153 [Pleopsidium flavum]|nr:MAG: hypothetical protein M1830_000153 [Pleopsidium flavum]
MATKTPRRYVQHLNYLYLRTNLIFNSQLFLSMDLAGNTFWEFKDALNANRLRRIVNYNPTTHYSDIQISPQWHQWLRQTRPTAPSIQEQQADLVRQAQLKHLARLADERWASKPSFLDKPKEQPSPATVPRDPGGYAGQTEPGEREGVRNAVGTPAEVGEKVRKENPWKRQRGGAGEEWQPEAWTPGPVKR